MTRANGPVSPSIPNPGSREIHLASAPGFGPRNRFRATEGIAKETPSRRQWSDQAADTVTVRSDKASREVRVDRHTPMFCQWKGRTSVIKVAMRQNDRFGRAPAPKRASAASIISREKPGSPVSTSTHALPGRPDKINVHETDRQPTNVGRDPGNGSHILADA